MPNLRCAPGGHGTRAHNDNHLPVVTIAAVPTADERGFEVSSGDGYASISGTAKGSLGYATKHYLNWLLNTAYPKSRPCNFQAAVVFHPRNNITVPVEGTVIVEVVFEGPTP